MGNNQSYKWKVDGRKFKTLNEARRHQKKALAGLPDDAIIDIYHLEDVNIGELESEAWIPYE
jgi:hypothetical protein